MTGFEAISHHNGWVMAAFGAMIVFSGLAVLSFVISQLPRVFALFEKRSEKPAVEVITEKTPPPEAASEAESRDPQHLAAVIGPLVESLEQPFQLADLYRLCRDNDLPHPHLSLSILQRQGFLVFQGEGSFTWKSVSANAQEG